MNPKNGVSSKNPKKKKNLKNKLKELFSKIPKKCIFII